MNLSGKNIMEKSWFFGSVQGKTMENQEAKPELFNVFPMFFVEVSTVTFSKTNPLKPRETLPVEERADL